MNVLMIIAVGYFVIRALVFVLVPLAVLYGVIYILVKLINLLSRVAPEEGGGGDV